MQIRTHPADRMMPLEREIAIAENHPFDRIPCVPFLGEVKGRIFGANTWDMWHDAGIMAETEMAVYHRFGVDRLSIGPNSLGIAEMLGASAAYTEQGSYIKAPMITDYRLLDGMVAVEAESHGRMKPFLLAAGLLQEKAVSYVPVEASVGGPFTISAFLRGTEQLLRDLRKAPEEVHRLMRVVTDSQKSCIKAMTSKGLGIAFADPVANPTLIGPRFYGAFAYPYMKELTDYVCEVSEKKGSLHMCGETSSIWKYFRTLSVNEVSLDNAVDLNKAVEELSDAVPITGNVPPVEVVMAGTKEDIFALVRQCIEKGRFAKKGYRLSTGCDIPRGTKVEKLDWFMEAAREFGKG